VTRACNSITQKIHTGGSQVRDQFGLHNETPFQKGKKICNYKMGKTDTTLIKLALILQANEH
jgi:hypothetical protein